jgi:hypothetical protein
MDARSETGELLTGRRARLTAAGDDERAHLLDLARAAPPGLAPAATTARPATASTGRWHRQEVEGAIERGDPRAS